MTYWSVHSQSMSIYSCLSTPGNGIWADTFLCLTDCHTGNGAQILFGVGQIAQKAFILNCTEIFVPNCTERFQAQAVRAYLERWVLHCGMWQDKDGPEHHPQIFFAWDQISASCLGGQERLDWQLETPCRTAASANTSMLLRTVVIEWRHFPSSTSCRIGRWLHVSWLFMHHCYLILANSDNICLKVTIFRAASLHPHWTDTKHQVSICPVLTGVLWLAFHPKCDKYSRTCKAY